MKELRKKFVRLLPEKRVRITQHSYDNGFQTWVKTIFLIDDRESVRLGDWTIGFFHCEHCGAYQAFHYHISPDNPVNKQAHNERNAFLREHAHGDGRVILFERDMQ